MPTCAIPSCGKHFSSRYRVGDKIHNLASRKYCLECSPFGYHNTKKLDGSADRRHGTTRLTGELRICGICHKPNTAVKGTKCAGCSLRKRRDMRSAAIYAAVGTACWYCDYDKGIAAKSVLEWHHVVPAHKLHNLTTREIIGCTWASIRAEVQKCVSLCCRCHREYHAGLIQTEELHKLQETKWKLFAPLLPVTLGRT